MKNEGIVANKEIPEVTVETPESHLPEVPQSIYEEIREVDSAIAKTEDEIGEREALVSETESRWDSLRSRLDLPPLQDKAEGISADESGLQKMRNQLQKLKERKQQLEQQEKSLNENDLIVSDSQVKAAEKVLGDARIPHESKLYRKREVIPEGGGEVPGSYVLTIFDPERPDQPAPAEITEEAFELIRAAKLAVNYGKRPNKNQEVSS